MVVVTIVAVMVVVVAVVKVLMWDAAIVGRAVGVEVLAIDVMVDVEFIEVVIVLKFALSVPYVSSDVAIDLFMGTLADIIIDVLTGIGVEVLTDVSANAFAVVMIALEFPVSTPLEGFSRCAAFDCRPLALLDCARVLQAWMPSYHV